MEPSLLTESQYNVFQLVIEGMSNKEISTKLLIAPATVKYHLTQIFRKYGVYSRAALVALVKRTEVITLANDSASDLFAKHKMFTDMAKFDLDRQAQEFRAQTANLRSREQIVAAWPAVLKAARIHADSAIGASMLTNLLKELAV